METLKTIGLWTLGLIVAVLAGILFITLVMVVLVGVVALWALADGIILGCITPLCHWLLI